MSRTRYGIADTRAAVAAGATTRTGLLDEAIARIRADDGWLRAVTELVPGAREAASRRDTARELAPLEGVVLAVKDVIDVAGTVTRAGSAARIAEPATRDAAVVARLRDAGALVLAKTATTELAAMDPTSTVNPHDRAATPGGSSSGSAAAVAAGFVPLALGTQTAGSLCRPAAYCGIAAWKPTFGLVPTDGLVPLAPSFDTVGFLARSVPDLAAVADTFGAGLGATPDRPAPRIAVPADLPDATDSSRALLAHAATRAADFADVRHLDPDPGDHLLALHRVVMAFEAYAAHRVLLTGPRAHLLGPRIRELLTDGARITRAEADEARAELDQRAADFWAGLDDLDAVLTLAVPGPAPRSLAATGPVHYLVPWTTRRGPLVVVPTAAREGRLPLAVMLAGRPGTDAAVLATAQRLADAM